MVSDGRAMSRSCVAVTVILPATGSARKTAALIRRRAAESRKRIGEGTIDAPHNAGQARSWTYGIGRSPSHFTFHVPSCGKPGALTFGAPSQPPAIKPTALNSDAFTGKYAGHVFGSFGRRTKPLLRKRA